MEARVVDCLFRPVLEYLVVSIKDEMLAEEPLAVAAAQLVVVLRKFKAEKTAKSAQYTAGKAFVSILFYLLAVALGLDLT